MNDITDKVADAATDLGKGVRGFSEDLRTRTKDAWDSVQDRTKRAVCESSAYVHENPVPTALAAFGLGLVLGLILSRCGPTSCKERCIATPLHQSQGVLLGLLIACGALLKRTFFSASSAAEELAENVGAGLRDTLKS